MSSKDPRYVESGRRGARRRWGEFGRILRLDDPSLLDEEREAIQALLRLKRAREARLGDQQDAAA